MQSLSVLDANQVHDSVKMQNFTVEPGLNSYGSLKDGTGIEVEVSQTSIPSSLSGSISSFK